MTSRTTRSRIKRALLAWLPRVRGEQSLALAIAALLLIAGCSLQAFSDSGKWLPAMLLALGGGMAVLALIASPRNESADFGESMSSI